MESAVIFNQNLLQVGEYYHVSSTIFDDEIIATCLGVDNDNLVLEENQDKTISHMGVEDVLHLGMVFENITIHPHDDDELDIEPTEEEMNHGI